MRTDEAKPVRLEDYRPPDWLVDTVELEAKLDPTATRVRSALKLRPNPEAAAPSAVVLDGDGLTLISVQVDGVALPPDSFVASPDRLTLLQPPPRPFRLEIETQIDPSANTQLMGLYRSSGTYCTQCEAEGFRRITYFPDRPDVMAVYTTRIEADRAEAPVLLANGNLIESGEIEAGHHFAVWHDPFPKPSYLFALVGGTLGCIQDEFVTMSGRKVALRIYVEPGKESRCAYAMDSLKRSMRWDEQAFGREYDLDVFMIVAVSDFNMGAMENKGLNVFNDKYVLASPETATDGDFATIEAIIAHEYFHNWTGNRITCRDWFQLCLKEGLTVFRDQEFTSDQRSRPVKRISDVRVLRGHQFVEDAGPLAHPVRPRLYHEINNFYTATVYEKGSEVVRMLKTLLGAHEFRAGMDLYFARHDGHAATIEQFLACFVDATGTDLSQFSLWYEQAGTPRVMVEESWDSTYNIYQLHLTQSVPPTPKQPTKQPMVIPLVFGLLDNSGTEMLSAGEGVFRPDLIVLREESQRITFRDLPLRPRLSINRGFSAPINLVTGQSSDDLRFLAAHDSDPFNRWQAVQTLATSLLVDNAARARSGAQLREDNGLVTAIRMIIEDERLEAAFIAQAMALPSEADVAREIGRDVDPDAIFAARRALRQRLSSALGDQLRLKYESAKVTGPYSPDAMSAGRRTLRNACLDLLVAGGETAAISLATQQYDQADNMTDRMGALAALASHDVPQRAAALDDFYDRFKSDALVVDKWLSLQAMIAEPGTLPRIRRLTEHSAFSFTNPNRVRALIGAFAHSNQTQFNRPDGEGYAFVADTILSLDGRNPQVAARLAGAFRSWRVLEPRRRAAAEAALRRIADTASLSPDLADIAHRALAETAAD